LILFVTHKRNLYCQGEHLTGILHARGKSATLQDGLLCPQMHHVKMLKYVFLSSKKSDCPIVVTTCH